ncbi:hypothetical protein THAOC_28768, partial [Thalassiosira oceanica]
DGEDGRKVDSEGRDESDARTVRMARARHFSRRGCSGSRMGKARRIVDSDGTRSDSDRGARRAASPEPGTGDEADSSVP